jgi:hypothetical protein
VLLFFHVGEVTRGNVLWLTRRDVRRSGWQEERKRVDETRALAESLRFEHSGMKVENADLRGTCHHEDPRACQKGFTLLVAVHRRMDA